MKGLNDIQTVIFLGIGGIGMSALARYCQTQGKRVMGYDKAKTQLTSELEYEDIMITYELDWEWFDSKSVNNKNSLVVYTPALSKNNRLIQEFIKRGFEVVKRAVFLGEVTKNSYCLAVAGTHGKTTTSAILGHLLAASNMPVTAFLGGVAENYQSNFISVGTDITVVEADEYDRSFLKLSPKVACVTSMDADHLDIYGTSEALQDSFLEFTKLVEDKNHVLVKNGLPLEGKTVDIDREADYSAQNIRIENGMYVFDLKTPEHTLKDLKFLLPGHHNLQNAVTALGMAILAGTPLPSLPKALYSFQGVRRRFSYRIKSDERVVIDDYAHHPTELDALHQAVSEMYPDDKKLIVFQPHLYSRTRDFSEGFAKSLSKFDEVFLLEIYPAREEPIPGIDSQWLLEKISNPLKALISKREMATVMKESECRILLMVGAGDIGEEVSSVTKNLMG